MRDSRDPKYRARKSREQEGCCHYCGFPMWSKGAAAFAKRYNLSAKEAALFKCTLEHLEARCDGGTSRLENVVAACLWCNWRRHHSGPVLPADRYLLRVRRRVAKKRWHQRRFHELMGAH